MYQCDGSKPVGQMLQRGPGLNPAGTWAAPTLTPAATNCKGLTCTCTVFVKLAIKPIFKRMGEETYNLP